MCRPSSLFQARGRRVTEQEIKSAALRLRERRLGGRGRLGQAPTQLECPQAVAALRELEAAATGQNRHVLLAVDLVGRRGSVRAGVGLELPQEIAIVDVVG